MPRRRSSARCSRAWPRGFTLSEVLVGLSVASLVIIGVGTGSVFVTRAWAMHQARVQVQQSIRGTVEALSRELRIAGACMPLSTLPPITSQFQAISGTHSGLTDSITITSNPHCAGPTNVNVDCNACAVINVDNTTNFSPGTWVYVYNSSNLTSPPGPYGEFVLIQSVASGSPGTITVSATTPLTKNYPHYDSTLNPPKGSSVWGADQRTFAISSTCSGCNGVPTLTLWALGGVVTPMVKGVDQMTIQYVLNRTYASNPTQCEGQTGGTLSLCVVNLPTTGASIAGDWQLVRAITFTIDARSLNPVGGSGSADGFLHRTEAFEISPRNFMFQSTPRVNWTPY
jgi:prepilin-type N-terminal cleavage/methylation domain-containing protein